MPYRPDATKQPHPRHHSHPLRRVLVEHATRGIPTPTELATIPGYTTSPTVRARVDKAVTEIRALADAGNNIGAAKTARTYTDQIGTDIAHLPTPLPAENTPPPESLDDIAARMFRR